ncbi:MAG: hypothetical protein IJ875_02690 [Solobacterium sp.]|nr:hypothetical protein [Solobacterium sp.]
MIRNFNEIEKIVSGGKEKPTAVLVGCHDEYALRALIQAKRKGYCEAILIGDIQKTKAILEKEKENLDTYSFMDIVEEEIMARRGVSLVKEGQGHILMKGLLQTSSYAKAILNKENGIMLKDGFLSLVTLFHYPEENRLLFVSDCAISITPSIEQKEKIASNAANLVHLFGIDEVKVAALAPVEVVNEKIQATIDADILAQKEYDGFIIDGPLALDNAINLEAAKHKGITSKVAGRADVLLCHDLNMANILHKSLHYFAHYEMASILCGTKYPCILTSRSDSDETKYHSLLVALWQYGKDESK